jgi:teichuronic acid biosynthesis glycosyltransferase TuaC
MTMRILLLSHIYPRRDVPTYGEFLHWQARALVAAGAEVTVVSPMMRAPWYTWWNPRWRAHADVPLTGAADGVRIYRPRYFSPPGLRWLWVEGRTMLEGVRPVIARLHAARPFDIMHCNRFFPEGYVGLGLRKQLGIPMVAMARGMDLNRLPQWGQRYRQALAEVVAGADGLLSVSASLFDEMRTLATPACPTQVIYNGCHVEAAPASGASQTVRDRYGIPRDALVALYVGRLEPAKGTPELVQVMSALTRRFDKLHWVAAGRIQSERYAADIARAGWADRAHLLGAVAHAEVEALLQCADLFVFPSRREGVPNAVIEAMSAGLPVVATRAGGVSEILPPECGFLCEVGDVQGIAAGLTQLLASAALRRRMGAAARAHAKRHFTWARNAQNLLAFYARCLGSATADGKQAA